MKIGFIGLGAMGRHMAANLQRAGHELQAYDVRQVEGFSNKTSAADFLFEKPSTCRTSKT